MGEPTTRGQRKLTAPRVTEVSAVDEPAHLHRGWIVKKAATDADARRLLAALGAGSIVPQKEYPVAKAIETLKGFTPFQRSQISDGESVLKALTDAQLVELKKDASGDDLQPLADQLAQVWMSLRDLISAENPDIPSIAVDPNAPDATAAAVAPAAPVAAAVPAAPDAAAILAAPALAKALGADQVELLKALVAKNAEAEQTLRKEREERADAEAVAEFAKAFGALDLDNAAVAPALRRYAMVDETGAAAIRAALTKSVEKSGKAESLIVAEIGKARFQAAPDSPEAGLEQIAKALHESGAAKTKEQALLLAYQQNPGLYEAARTSKKGA